jgi:hypothetical protein
MSDRGTIDALEPMRDSREQPTSPKHLLARFCALGEGDRLAVEFLFDWYDRPENVRLKTRFSFAMACSMKLEPPEAVLNGAWDVTSVM